MSRNPGETTEQWRDRANAHYLHAWEAFGVEWWPGEYPLLDEGSDGAVAGDRVFLPA